MTVHKLTSKQLRAIGLLAQGLPHHEVARQSGVSQRTVERWATRPDIKEAVDEARSKTVAKMGEEIFERCREGLIRGLPKSVTRVLAALDHSDARIQIKAAELVSKWSGFYQPTAQIKPDQQSNAEQNLKGYLSYLEASGNGNQHQSIQP